MKPFNMMNLICCDKELQHKPISLADVLQLALSLVPVQHIHFLFYSKLYNFIVSFLNIVRCCLVGWFSFQKKLDQKTMKKTWNGYLQRRPVKLCLQNILHCYPWVDFSEFIQSQNAFVCSLFHLPRKSHTSYKERKHALNPAKISHKSKPLKDKLSIRIWVWLWYGIVFKINKNSIHEMPR